MATDQERAVIREEADLAANDPFYTDDYLDDLMLEEGTIRAVVYRIWRRQAARYSKLVDTTESGSSRRMSQLHANALKMVDFYKPVTQEEVAQSSGPFTVAVERA